MIVNDNSVTITLRYGDLDTAIAWCQETCVGVWDLREIVEAAGYANGTYQFEFEDSRDVVLFELRWG